MLARVKPPIALTALTALLALAPACTGDDESSSNTPVTGGSSGTMAATGGSAGIAGSGGAVMMTGGSGGRSGAGGSGGSMSSGGAGGSGGSDMSSGGQTGSGGMGDTGGSSPMPDAGGDMYEPTPSAGCGTAGRPTDGLVSVADSHYFAFPESYDGTEPYPVLMALHGCAAVNRGTSAENTEWMYVTRESVFATDYVRAIPVSANTNGCWSYDADAGRIKQVYDQLLANHCVDTSRVFATGHSSGAQMVVQILLETHTADAAHVGFDAVAPVAASDYGAMSGPIPVMYIQGMMDAERGNGDGHETVERFRAANGCGDSSTAYTEVEGCQSGSTAVNPGCVSYEGCDAPTIWCSHNDPEYGGTMHGIPCFALTAMHDFFTSVVPVE